LTLLIDLSRCVAKKRWVERPTIRGDWENYREVVRKTESRDSTNQWEHPTFLLQGDGTPLSGTDGNVESQCGLDSTVIYDYIWGQ